MPASAPAPYRVRAYNTARESENKIHDDAVAKRFGFTGGLVPGVDVYAYFAHAPVAHFGRAWLERGTAECRLAKPVYDGDEAVVIVEPDGEGLAFAWRATAWSARRGVRRSARLAGTARTGGVPNSRRARTASGRRGNPRARHLLGMHPLLLTRFAAVIPR